MLSLVGPPDKNILSLVGPPDKNMLSLVGPPDKNMLSFVGPPDKSIIVDVIIRPLKDLGNWVLYWIKYVSYKMWPI